MNFEEISHQLNAIEEAIPKLKDLISDIQNCSTETSKMILVAALKKYSTPISEFKL